MSETIDDLKAKLLLFENDASKRGFYSLNRIINQQIDLLNNFTIISRVSSDEKSDIIMFKNVKEIWENLPKMITALNQLRIDMKIDGEEEKDIPKIVPISPQSISKISFK